MNQHKKNISSGQPVQIQENHSMSIHTGNRVQDELWMEFEESFIQVLSGIEPGIKYYSTLELQEQISS